MVKERKGVLDKQLVQILVEEYLTQPNILCYDQKELRDLLSEFDVQLLGLVDRYYSLHVLLLDKVDDLAAVRHDFKGLASHQGFFLLKDLPVLKA